MMIQSEKNTEKSLKWLKNEVFPLWSTKGVDPLHGGFVESLTFSGEVMKVPRRAMVQARQIYSFRTGATLGCCPTEISHNAILQGLKYLISTYSQRNGSFAYSVSADGKELNPLPDLYTQAFALFGLAQGYALFHDDSYKNRALELVHYLKSERAVSAGGYTEINDSGDVLYRSNPHMHLYEAVIAWMQVDPSSIWKELGDELTTLCVTKFICPTSQVLAEYFDSQWNPLREEGRFIYEPGHQYEWAWLLKLYEELTHRDLQAPRGQLFNLAEKHGVSATRKVVYDEMWSDYTPKTTSSRFWPQCERIKAAVRLGHGAAADEALQTLFRYFETPLKGTWYDALSSEDIFTGTAAKASSLYHIINAIEEYVNLRPRI